MEIKELVPKLVEHYQRCIDEIPENNWLKYAKENKVDLGICYCATRVFNQDIYGSDFASEFTRKNIWICKTPLDVKSYSEAKELLQIRLNRLKEFLTNQE